MIRVGEAGVRSTVQDRGRFGHLRSGVPTAGPADPFALAAANALVGNAGDAAGIEIIGTPFRFSCDDARVVAVAGRDVSLATRSRLPGWGSVFVRAGQTVTVHSGERTRYAYLAVSGGIATTPVLGSRATYLPAFLGAPLRSGDLLPLGEAEAGAEDAARRIEPTAYDGQVRAIAGPHHDRFEKDAVGRFFAARFVVEPASDRQGVRLGGVPIAPRAGELLSCGVLAGAVQVPRGGAPIVLLADHQTTGGYPVIATVIAADVGKVAQRQPGESLRFYRVERDEALDALRAERRALDDARASA
ncbi:MAG TPA: biotin-dependent carboxyltransferase family protein [Candidatus Limnocylindria bacterium]|nr:biotin-dependent carboxyltransferase family protein [Candidatus Limnocylindria bacterium]